VILTDAGPLVALLDAGEPDHVRCVSVLDEITLPLVTTWPAFTEAMYLLGRMGWQAQSGLWRLVGRGDLEILDLGATELERVAALMERYADRPMDLADATLVAVAERDGHRTIFSLDADFHVYRLGGRRSLTVLPR